MTRKPEVLRDYTRMNPLSQVQFGNNVIAALMANPTVFIPADLPVSVADLTAATNDLSTRYNEYKQYGLSKKEAFLVAQVVWVERMNLTADYVELVANTSGQDAGVIIQLSTFRITKTETDPAVQPVSPIANMSIDNQEKGKFSVKVKPVEGAKGFVYTAATPDFEISVEGNQITLKVGESVACIIVGTQREVKFSGIQADEVSAAVAAFNSAGLGSFCAPVDVTIP